MTLDIINEDKAVKEAKDDEAIISDMDTEADDDSAEAPAEMTTNVPTALIKSARKAMGELQLANDDYEQACEDRKAAKLTLDAAQIVYNVASEHVINYSKSGFPADTPLADVSEGDDSWRYTAIDSLGIDLKHRKRLEAHEPSIKTLGELEAWRAKKGQFWGKDIKSFGDAGVTAVEDMLSAFWADWNDKQEVLRESQA